MNYELWNIIIASRLSLSCSCAELSRTLFLSITIHTVQWSIRLHVCAEQQLPFDIKSIMNIQKLLCL